MVQVHKVTLLVVDHNELGREGVIANVENADYANHCISPNVMGVETREVDWDDDHPFNSGDVEVQIEAFDLLFGHKFSIVGRSDHWEYRCVACNQMRYHADTKAPVKCAACGATNITVARPGELEKHP